VPLQLELKKVTLNQGIAFQRTATVRQQPQQQKRQQRSRQSNRGEAVKAIVVITPFPHRAVATLQASVLELWL
jgi:hypothetical protein